jgi:uncharacterized iron-regulated membrane protein
MTFRGIILWVHLILGLTGALVIAVLGVTGAYITFQDRLTARFNTTPTVAEHSGAIDVVSIRASIDARYAPRQVTSVASGGANDAVVVRLDNRDIVFVDPASGNVVGERPWRLLNMTNVTRLMRRLHVDLVMGRVGRIIVTAATAQTIFLLLTGLWLWWRKRWWKVRLPRASFYRVTWEWHNAMGLWFALPVVVMAVTGVLIFAPEPVYRAAGVGPAPWPRQPSSAAPAPGTAALPLERALQIADSLRPGVSVTGLGLPTSASDVYSIRTKGGVMRLDQYSGAVIEVAERVPTEGDRAYAVLEAMHSGEHWGNAGQLVMTLGSLMLSAMAATGAALGWKRLLILSGRRRRDLDD